MYDQDDKMVSCWEVAAQIVSEEGLNSTPKSINLLWKKFHLKENVYDFFFLENIIE